MKLPISLLLAGAALATTSCSVLAPVFGQNAATGTPTGYATGARPVGFIYTTLYGKNAIMEIDAVQSRANPDPILTPNGPRALAVDPRGIEQYLYVVCSLANTVAVIDRRSRQVIRSINVGNNPYDIVLTPDGSRAFVTNQDDDTVSVIDTTSNNVVGTVQLNAPTTNAPPVTGTTGTTASQQVRMKPQGIASNASGTRIYVACAAGYMVELDGAPPTIDPNTNTVTKPGNQYSAVRNVPLTGSVQPQNIAVSSDSNGDGVYITDPQGGKFFSIAPNQATAQQFTATGQPWGVAVGYNAGGHPDTLYVTMSAGNSVIPYSLPALTPGQGANILGHNPQSVAVSPDGNDIYVSVTGDNSVCELHKAATSGTPALTAPEYFSTTTLNQQYVTSTGDLALGGYLF